MYLTKCNSMLHADVVLAYLRMIVGSCSREDEILIRAWSNCREQGYHLSSGDFVLSRHAVLAECRNSDSVLVITGNYKDFDFQTHQPTEAAYAQRRNFSYGKELDAANFLMDWLGAKLPNVDPTEKGRK